MKTVFIFLFIAVGFYCCAKEEPELHNPMTHNIEYNAACDKAIVDVNAKWCEGN